MTSDPFLWRPSAEVRAQARLAAFLEQCELDSFEALHRRSVEDIGWFTEQVLRFLQIDCEPAYEQILDLSNGPAWPRWCVGGGLNISRMCLDRHLHTRGSEAAIIWESEGGETRSLSYRQLAVTVGECAAGLRLLGLGRGSAIGVHLPMVPETAVVLLAIARIGGIAIPLFSGFGVDAVETRLRSVGAAALITFDAFQRRGKSVLGTRVANQVRRTLTELRHLIVVSRKKPAEPLELAGALMWDELLTNGRTADPSLQEADLTDADAPLAVLYSSGTTGEPKGILHTHCGFPIKAAQDMALGMDVGPGTRILWITDTGWMMGPWLIYGGLLLGATAVLYDGAPDHPAPDRLWSLCERHGVQVLGLSPTLVRTLMAWGESGKPRLAAKRSLRILASTGEPWTEAAWHWLFDQVGDGRLPIINYSGGTEIGGGILMGNPLLPMKACSFPAPCPGIDADVLDEGGMPIRGGVGELVIRQPWIGMARGFWGDPARYLATYWSRWPEVWVHGDWAQVDSDGHWLILGRSDDTLNVAGRRIGPAEVESALSADETILEAAVIGVPDERLGTAMIALCVPLSAISDEHTFLQTLRESVGIALGKPLRPKRLVLVPQLPKTRSGKIMRRVVRAAWLGEDPGDVSALENPEAIEQIREARGLER